MPNVKLTCKAGAPTTQHGASLLPSHTGMPVTTGLGERTCHQTQRRVALRPSSCLDRRKLIYPSNHTVPGSPVHTTLVRATRAATYLGKLCWPHKMACGFPSPWRLPQFAARGTTAVATSLQQVCDEAHVREIIQTRAILWGALHIQTLSRMMLRRAILPLSALLAQVRRA